MILSDSRQYIQRLRAGLSVLLSVVFFIILAGCSGPNEIAGSISETGNAKVAGIITDSSGNVSVSAKVFLVPSGYAPSDSAAGDDILRTVTDGAGRFSFSGLDAGVFTIEAYNNGRSHGGIERDVIIASSESFVETDEIRLEKTGSISVSLEGVPASAAGKVYLPGTLIITDFNGVENDSGKVLLSNVPPGSYPGLYFVSGVGEQPLDLSDGELNCHPGVTTVIDREDPWKYRRKININTSASGAGITEDVYGFPLLVRLTEENFDFSLADEYGDDLRFTDRNSSELSCEIEFWSDSSAIVWVRVPVIYGDNTEQFIIMKWGNPDALAVSDPEAVFDTALGFMGVWHLNEEAGNVFDATINGIEGSNEKTESAYGVTGRAREFDSSRIDLGSSPEICSLLDSITVSGWIKTSQMPDTTVSVIRSHEHFTALQFDSLHAWTAFFNRDSSYSAVTFDWKDNFADDKWHYFTVRFKAGEGCMAFLDSVLIGENIINTERLNNSSQGFLLGGTESYDEYFRGMIDELRVERAYRSEAWVRLCYMNQKEGSNVLSFE